MIGFWIAAALISAAAAMLILYRAAAARASAPATRDVYARQLDEIDDLSARGLIGEPERKAARAEAARRLIGAADDEAREAEAAAPGAGRRVVLAMAVLAPLLAVGLYLAVGSPRSPDQPFAGRLAQWRKADPSSLDVARMTALLEQLAVERPNDPKLLIYLARAEAAQGQSALAVRTLEHAARLAPERADIWAAIGQGLSEIANGDLTPDARDAFAHSLKLDPKSPLPRYRLAQADIAAGKVDQGLAAWRALAGELPAADPRRVALESEIAAVVRTGRLPPPPAAAPQSSGGEQQAFIQSMVDRLAARLKAQPDDPSGWARLIRAYGVLGQDDRRQAAIAEVKRRYGSRPALEKSILEGR